MKEMVVGFYYNINRDAVTLIKKNKPEWQKGLFNGVGGKIEEGETPFVAMKREFEEEANASIDTWKHFVTMTDFKNKWRVYFFCAFGPVGGITSLTDEEVFVIDMNSLPSNMIPNLKWLIPLGIDFLETAYQPIDVSING